MAKHSGSGAGTIFNIMRFSVNDGPGIRSTVFLKGCPLACPWCHNPESIGKGNEIILRPDRCIRCGVCIDVCAHHAVAAGDGQPVTDRALCTRCGECVPHCYADARALVGRVVTTEEVLHDILRDRIFFDESGGGVTFSGGEPLMQHDFLESLLAACRQVDLHTAVDTTGYASSNILARIAPLVDLFLYDLKMMEDEKHRRYTGVSNVPILENLRRLVEWERKVIVRIPLIPGVNDDWQNFRSTGEFLASLPSIREIHLLPYHPGAREKYFRLGKAYGFDVHDSPDLNHVAALQEELQRYVPSVIVGG
jgi:pyruvate formate lyase activating enzyme